MSNLLDIEQKLAQGEDLDTINVQEASSQELASLYLRIKRENIFLSQALMDVSNSQSIEKKFEVIRNMINLNRLELAQKYLSDLGDIPEVYLGEYFTERLRIFVFSDDFDGGIAFAKENQEKYFYSPVTQMTFLQLYGHCLIAKKEYYKALEVLEEALRIGRIYPNVKSFYQSFGFYIVSLVHLDRLEEAKVSLLDFKSYLNQEKGTEAWPSRYQTYLRTKSYILRKEENMKELMQVLYEAKAISTWIGDQSTYEKCVSELAKLQGDFPESAYCIYTENFIYLKESMLVLHFDHATYHSLEKNPVLNGLLSLICEGEISYADLFQQTWNLEFHPEKHSTHVRSYISKIRKFLPKDSLKVKSEMISIV